MSRFWTKKPQFRGERAFFSMVKLSILTILCPVLLTACGESTPRGYNGSPTSDTLKPIAAPPGADEQPPLAGMTGAPKTADGLPALTAKGANTALFSSKLSDEVDRLDRLENAVQELRNDFDAMAPAIVRLVSIEKDLQNLINQLDMLTNGAAAAAVPPIEESSLEEAEPMQPSSVPLPPTGDDGTLAASEVATDAPQPITPPATPEVAAATPATPPQTAPVPATPAAQPAPPPVPAPSAAPAASTSSGTAVTGIRTGEHPGKVRIVLDLNGKSSYTADLDNAEKILVVELPAAKWNAPAQQNFTGNPVIVSYSTEAIGDTGTRLIMQLKSGTSIVYQGTMNTPENGGSRVILDLSTK